MVAVGCVVLTVPQFREAMWRLLAPVLFVGMLAALVGGLVLWIRRQDRRDSAEITGKVFRDDLTQVFPLRPPSPSAANVPPPLPEAPPRAKAPPPILEKPLADRLREVSVTPSTCVVHKCDNAKSMTLMQRSGMGYLPNRPSWQG